MQKTKLRNLIIAAVTLLLAAAAAFALSPRLLWSAASGNGETDFEIEEIAIDEVALTADGGAVKIRPKQSIALSYTVYPAYAAETVRRVEYSVIKGAGYADLSDSGILTVRADAAVYESVSVQVKVNDTYSNVYTLLIDKIPVESVSLTAESQTVNEGGSVRFSADVAPSDSSFKEVKYEIVGGSVYAEIDSYSGVLRAASEMRNGSAEVTVQAVADGVKSNPVTLSIYTPAKSLKLTADDLYPVSAVNFTSEVSPYASVNNPTLTIVDGGEFVQSFENGKLIVKKGITAFNPEIRVRAEQDGLVSEVLLRVRIPLKGIAVSCEQTVIHEGAFLQLDKPVLSPVNATDAVEYRITEGEQYAGVTPDGLISVNDEIPLPDACIQVAAYSDGIKSNELTFSIFVPAERVELRIEGDADKNRALIAGRSYGMSVLIGGVSTLREYRYVIESGSEFAEISGDRLTVRSGITAENPIVMLYAVCGEVRSNTVRIDVVIPLESIELFYASNQIVEGESLSLSSFRITPANATDKNIKFEITEGADYGTVDALGRITASADMKVPDGRITVRAYIIGCEGTVTVYSNSVTLSVYVPARFINLSADRHWAAVTSEKGDAINLRAEFNASATLKSPRYIIADDSLPFAYMEGAVLIVRSDLRKTAEIKVRAEQDGVLSEILVVTARPLGESIVLNRPLAGRTVEQFRTYDFSAAVLPSYAADRVLYYGIEAGGDIARITADGKLTVSGNAQAGAVITLKISSSDVFLLIDLTVKAIEANSIDFAGSYGSKLAPNESLSFSALLDGSFTVASGFELLIGGDGSAVSVNGNTLAVKSREDLERLNKNSLSFTVTLRALSGVRSAPYTFTVRIPVDKITVMSESTVQRGGENTINLLFNDYGCAYDKGAELSDFVGLDAEDVLYDSAASALKVNVPLSLKAGTCCSITVTSIANPNVSVTVELIVAPLNAEDFAVVFDSEDSEGYAIDLEKPQLWTGRSLSGRVTYKGKSVVGLDLEYSFVSSGCGFISDGAGFTVCPETTGIDDIKISVSIRDGLTAYPKLNAKTVETFRPAGSLDFIYTPPVKAQLNVGDPTARYLTDRMSVKSGVTKPSEYLFTSQNYNMTLFNGYITDINASQNYIFAVSAVYYYNGRKVTPEGMAEFRFLPDSKLSAVAHTGEKTVSSRVGLPAQTLNNDTVQLLIIAYMLNKPIKFDFTVELKEIKCGFQEFYVSCWNGTMFSQTNYEYGGSGKDWLGIQHPCTDWGEYENSFTVTSYHLESIFSYRYIYFEFGANGGGKNDWAFRKVTYSLGF